MLALWESDIAGHDSAASIAGDLSDNLAIDYNTTSANTLRAGKGFDAFFATYAQDNIHARPGDLVNGSLVA
ncbi:MAG TPA: hypothetical protein VNH11_00765 [Pirellulales bacterium]|nr:hypothetical protein [Pirellulales bacterium]